MVLPVLLWVAPAATGSDAPYLVLWAYRRSTLEKELAAALTRGYWPKFSPAGWSMVVLKNEPARGKLDDYVIPWTERN
jgi:hypothetical protein